MNNISYTGEYIQYTCSLVRSVQVDKDVDGGHQHFSKNEDDDDPLEQFTLYRSADVRQKSIVRYLRE